MSASNEKTDAYSEMWEKPSYYTELWDFTQDKFSPIFIMYQPTLADAKMWVARQMDRFMEQGMTHEKVTDIQLTIGAQFADGNRVLKNWSFCYRPTVAGIVHEVNTEPVSKEI